MGNLLICNSPLERVLNYKSPIANYKFFCSPYAMELRKDPITRSWVITGDDVIEPRPQSEACRFCGASAQPAQVIANLPGLDGGPWSARSVVHPHALYHIEGEAARRGDGLYDRMGRSALTKSCSKIPVTTAISGMPATSKWNSSFVWPRSGFRI